jgi:hypothetical protein
MQVAADQQEELCVVNINITIARSSIYLGKTS